METDRGERLDMEKSQKRIDREKAKVLKGGYLILILIILLAISFIFAFTQYKANTEGKKQLATAYMASLNKAVEHTTLTSELYDSVRLSRKPEQAAVVFASIWKESTLAHETISTLNYSNGTLTSALDYLSKSTDTSFRLMEKTMNGEELSNDDWKEVEELRKYGISLSDQLSFTLSDINVLDRDITNTLIASGNIFDDSGLNKTSLLASAGSLFGTEENPPITFSEIYQGNPRGHNLKFLKNTKEITSEEGKEAVRMFLYNYNIESIDFVFETDLTAEFAIPKYSYDITLAGDVAPQLSMDITQSGGYPVWMLNYSEIDKGDNFISIDKAKELAFKFLDKNNYKDMLVIDWENAGDYATITFIPYIGEILYYSDAIKIKVSLINGEIIGFESSKYIDMHHEREEREPKLSVAKVKELVSEQIEITGIYRAMIPDKNNASSEVLCYEFRGTFDGSNYSIFMNVDTGKQEMIVKVNK